MGATIHHTMAAYKPTTPISELYAEQLRSVALKLTCAVQVDERVEIIASTMNVEQTNVMNKSSTEDRISSILRHAGAVNMRCIFKVFSVMRIERFAAYMNEKRAFAEICTALQKMDACSTIFDMTRSAAGPAVLRLMVCACRRGHAVLARILHLPLHRDYTDVHTMLSLSRHGPADMRSLEEAFAVFNVQSDIFILCRRYLSHAQKLYPSIS